MVVETKASSHSPPDRVLTPRVQAERIPVGEPSQSHRVSLPSSVNPALHRPLPASTWRLQLRALQATAGNAAVQRMIERVASHRSATHDGPRSTTHTLQRLTNAADGAVIDIAGITYLGEARNALAKLNQGVYVGTEEDRQLLNQRITALHETIEAQTADATVETMQTLNNGNVKYYHNAVQQNLALVTTLTDAGRDPANGYASPAFFTRVSPFTWTLNENRSASAALRAFLTPTGEIPITIVECQTAAQAAFYNSILLAVGDQRFDRKFGRADAVTPAENRMRLERDMTPANPLKAFLEAPSLDVENETEANELGLAAGNVVSAPDFRPARRGGWYYVANHPKYTHRHPDGIWGGENAIYVGRNDEDHQVFSGFGMENVTEAVLAQHLAEEFCAAPTPAETQKILNMRQQFWPLILPTLGDLDSLADLPLLSAAGLAALQGAWEFV